MKQVAKKPDNTTITSQGTTGAFTNGLITEKLETVKYDSLQIMKNFDITKSGALITRPGLTTVIDLNEFIEFDRLLKYVTNQTGAFKTTVQSNYFSDILKSTIKLEGTYGMLEEASKYKFIMVKVKNNNGYDITITIPKQSYYKNILQFIGDYYIKFSIQEDSIIVLDKSLELSITNLYAVQDSYDDRNVIDDDGARGFLETAIVYTYAEDIEVWCRYSKLDVDADKLLEEGTWHKSGVLDNISESEESLKNFYLTKRLFVEFANGNFFIKTPKGLFELIYYNDYGIKLYLVNLMEEKNEQRYKPNSAEITNNGYNILSPFPEQEVKDTIGVINSITGIIIQGTDVSNKHQPFKVQKELMLTALVSYVTEEKYKDFGYKWSYDYIGSSYTENLSINKKSGDNEINTSFSPDNKTTYFTPTHSGMYQIYCQMEPLTELKDDDGNPTGEFGYVDSGLSIRYTFQDVSVEVDVNKNDKDILYLYEGLKRSKLLKPFKNFFVVGGASQTTPFSSILFISAPRNPTYFPSADGYKIELPEGVIVSDFYEYNERLVILTNKGVYFLEGDVPNVSSYTSTSKNLQAFDYRKVITSISSFRNDNSAVTTDGVVMVNSNNIHKLFDYSTNLSKLKEIGNEVFNSIPNGGFDFVQQILNRSYMVKEDEILIYESLEYNSYGISDRYLFYHTHGLIVKDIFYDFEETFFVLDRGLVCRLDKTKRGYDLTHPFTTEFKTNNNTLGNSTLNKKFKKLYYDIAPLTSIGGQDINYEKNYFYGVESGCSGKLISLFPILPEKENGEEVNFSLDVFLDNEQVINSMYIETVKQFGGGVKVYRVHNKNSVVKTDMYMMKEKDNFIAFGRNELYNIYGTDMIDWEQLGQHSYTAEVKLRGRGKHKGISTMMRFDKPVIINNLGYDFSNKKAKGDYSGNNFHKYKRVRR